MMQRTPTAADNYVGEEGFFIEEPPDSVGPGDNVVADFQRANLLLRDERGARGKNTINYLEIISYFSKFLTVFSLVRLE